MAKAKPVKKKKAAPKPAAKAAPVAAAPASSATGDPTTAQSIGDAGLLDATAEDTSSGSNSELPSMPGGSPHSVYIDPDGTVTVVSGDPSATPSSGNPPPAGRF